MVITYSGASAPTADVLEQAGLTEGIQIQLNRGSVGDINWGRATANTELNPDISNVTNKKRMRELFAEKEVPAPRLVPVQMAEREVLNTTLIGRPDKHTRGRALWICRTPRDVRKALRGTRRKRAATHFMEYIHTEVAPREYRVHVFMGKSLRISEKMFGTTGETAHGLYTTGKPRHNVKHVRKAAKKAVEAVGLHFGAVDVLAGDDNAYVLEVNAAPGLGGSMPRVYIEAFNRWRTEQ